MSPIEWGRKPPTEKQSSKSSASPEVKPATSPKTEYTQEDMEREKAEQIARAQKMREDIAARTKNQIDQLETERGKIIEDLDKK